MGSLLYVATEEGRSEKESEYSHRRPHQRIEGVVRMGEICKGGG